MPQHDAIIIGAGIAGLYQLHRLRELGLDAQVLEAGSDVGGTWYWNRYPGARFDSESYSYGYSFSEELLTEWQWSEHFSPQPETLRYVNHVADRFDLRRDIRFDSEVSAARWDEDARCWQVRCADGFETSGRFLITAIGVFAAPTLPEIPGRDEFRGLACHTARWPHEPVDFSGKRVAVIGTGATGVQVIQEVAKSAAGLTVFQRTPNWCAPLNNRPITDAEQVEIRARYPEIFARCRESHGGFIHVADPRNAMETPAAERLAFWEQRYAEPGFGIWMGNFRDIFIDPEANAALSAFVADKIRQRVNDPAIAEKLIPTNHGFGTRRVPLESGYYEVYNQDNVELVDIRETPIERITPTGIRTRTADGTREFEFDIIIHATGFDAVLGGFERIDIRGTDGRTLKDKWSAGPRTFLGLSSAGFPNLFTLVGPHNAATFCNIPRCIEQNVDWLTDLMRHAARNGITRIEAVPDAEQAWTEHVYESAERMLFTRTDSWFMGVNSNVPGRDRRNFLLYAAGAPAYRERCDAVAAEGYAGFELTA